LPLSGGAGSQFNAIWPGPRPTSVSSGILIHPAVRLQQTWAENWEAVPLWGRVNKLGPHLHNVVGAEAYIHAKFHLDPCNRLDTVHQRHRQDRTDNGPIAYGEPFYKRSPKN